jgi:hypothetical protein
MTASQKKIYLIIMTAITVSGFIIICTLGQSIHRERMAAKLSDIAAAEPVVISVFTEYNGRIGVFREGSSKPYRIIDYDFSLLSDYDKEHLKQGIIIESDRELQQFIEDIAS